ncbi:PIN domain-containing protein [Patescibacteria group bacterium AH-259-L05]|nr:PIN domain-containing protein [Patescibacteria group bacterium AH-259-L05]
MSESECCSLADYQEKQIFTEPLIIVDTSILLKYKERHCLTHFFNVYIPSAVSWQIKKISRKGSVRGGPYVRKQAKLVKKMLFQMRKQNKWRRFKSKETDVKEKITRMQLRDFSNEGQEKLRKFFKRKATRDKQAIDYFKITVYDLIGQTDIKILTDAHRLQKQNSKKVILATRDELLLLVAEALDIASVNTLQRPDVIKIALQG